MTEEIRYIANLQKQEEFDNEVTELEDELNRLEQENDCLRIANAKLHEDLSQTETSMREWKSKRDKAVIAYNDLILDIVSDIPFTADIGGERHISIKDHLHQMQKALSTLEEIREMILYCEDEYNCDRCKYHDNCLVDDDNFPDFSKALVNKINEVLGDESDKNIR